MHRCLIGKDVPDNSRRSRLPPWQRLRVLLLDDAPFTLEPLRTMLAELGSFDVFAETDARRALAGPGRSRSAWNNWVRCWRRWWAAMARRLPVHKADRVGAHRNLYKRTTLSAK